MREKFYKRIMCVLLCVVLILSNIQILSAAENSESPYDEWQTIDGQTMRRCTWYAWKLAYERTGTAMPGFGNAGEWYESAREAGYRVGTEAEVDSIAVWKGGINGWGHVGYVDNVQGEQMHILEGGRTDCPDTGGIGEITLPKAIGTKRAENTLELVGFIYLDTVVECGAEGGNVHGKMNQNGVLTITGSGAMASWEMEQAPWYRFKDDIKEVIIERGVTSIGDFAFYNCSNLSKVTIGEDVASVGAYGFSYCTSLEEIKIPNSVTEIGEFAFSYCSNLKDITLSFNLAKIAMGMFAYCSTLDSIILPQNIAVIEDQAFDGCFSLVSITFLGNAPRFTSDTNIFSGVEAFIYYPAQNDTWTAEIMKQYGGNVIWTVESKEEGQKEEVANPVVPTSIDKNWEGSYVYMGHYQLKEIQSEVLTGILDETPFDENNLATMDGVEYYKQEEKYYERVPVRWQVLQQDDTSMLLLSEKILDAHEFDNSTSGGDIRWYNSDLREWLGNEFYNTCFDAEEQTAVITTENSNDTGSELSGGPNTFDKVFLLSDQQMGNSEYGFWGGSDESATRTAHYIPGVETKVTTWTMGFTNQYILNLDDQTCYYWTRTPYNLRYGFALSPKFVTLGGMVGFSNSVVQTWKVGIRPAIQVDKNSDQWYTDIQVRNLYLSQTEMLLGKGQESPLSVTVMPSEYVDTNVLWKSSNPSVVSVDQTGMVTALADGEATITAMSSNGVTASCSVTVGNHVNTGDINADGSVELTDLMSCLHHVSGSNMLEGAPLQAADVNGDGMVDLTDLMRILHYVSGSSTEL